MPQIVTELTSWNDGPTLQAIENFVSRVTTKGKPGFVPRHERIAVFDNDGTLWCEKPMPIELGFILQRLAAMAEGNSDLRDRQPWKSAFNKEYSWLGDAITKHYKGDDSDVKLLLAGVLKAFEGMTVERYGEAASDYLRKGRHPTLERSFSTCVYPPMVELLRYLETHGFTNFIVSGGDRDFMRVISDDIYGITPDRVVGSSVGLRFQMNNGIGAIVYEAQPDVFDDGPAKPVRIWSRIGRRPILAAGNSNGDIPMLQFASEPSRPSLCLLINHDDEGREFSYQSGAEDALDQARSLGWSVVSIKNDWDVVFSEKKTSAGKVA